MRVKPLLAVSLGLALGLAATQAGAFGIKAFNGEIDIKFSGYSTEKNSGYGSGAFPPNNVSAIETTWGLGFLTEIDEAGNSSNVLWQQKNPAFGNETIGYMLYGIADGNYQQTPGGGFTIYNQGCTGAPCDGNIHIDFYVNPPGVNFSNTPTSNRSGFSSFPGITNGDFLMRWVLVPGIQSVDVPNVTPPLIELNPGYDEQNATLVQNTLSTTLPTTGSGSFYANCVSGPGCAQFVPQQYTTALGTQADFFGIFSLTGVTVTATGPGSKGWQGRTSDPINAFTVPEPASVTLLGIGLLGLAALRRRGRGLA